MNKFTTLAALCLFSLMATVSHAEEMKNDGGMMQDNMQSDGMSHSMDDMSMESDHMDTTDSMKE